MRYFKVTNDEEVHNGFVYKDGLNIQDAFEDDPNVMGAGFYFTTIDAIPKYYYMGINLRQVHLPENCQCVRMEHKYRSDKLILGKRYSLYDTETYQHFGLKMEDNIHLVNHASETGNIIFLNEWQKMDGVLNFPLMLLI